MTNMKKLLKMTLMISLLVVFACDDLLDTEPNDRISNENAVSDYEGLVSALLGGYDRLRNNSDDFDQGNTYYRRDFIIIADALADNLKQPANNTSRLLGVSDNTPYSHFNFWAQAYQLINSANFVISSVGTVDHSDQQELDQLHAEALFLRAMGYFDLMRAYARNPNYPVDEPLGVPIVTAIISPIDAFPARNQISEVYDQIIDDLNQAADLINTSLIFPNRASIHAINALLARVHLYAGNWEEAINHATAVIDNVGFDIESVDYVNIFSDQSETIFGISYAANESPGLNGSLEGILYVDPDIDIGYGDFVIREGLLNLYEEGDVRAELFISTTKGGEPVTYVGKYLGYGGTFGQDHIPLIRLSEMYLTRAEAKAEEGADLSGAIADLNKIRERAGLSATSASSQSEVLEAVLKERRLELAFEGHRIFDLKRRGLDIPKGESGTDCQDECLVPYADYRVIANIPTWETDANSNVEQNPRY